MDKSFDSSFVLRQNWDNHSTITYSDRHIVIRKLFFLGFIQYAIKNFSESLSLLMYATIILYQTEQPITSWQVVLWPLLVALSGLVVCAVCTRLFYLLLEVWCR